MPLTHTSVDLIHPRISRGRQQYFSVNLMGSYRVDPATGIRISTPH